MRRALISAIALASLLVPSVLYGPGALSQTIEDVATAAKAERGGDPGEAP